MYTHDVKYQIGYIKSLVENDGPKYSESWIVDWTKGTSRSYIDQGRSKVGIN